MLKPSVTEQIPLAHLAPIRNTAPTCTLDAMLLDFPHNQQPKAAQGIPKPNLVGPPYPSISSLLNPEKNVPSHPVSKPFTDIQRTFLNMTSLPEQVAMLLLMFLLLRWQNLPYARELRSIVGLVDTSPMPAPHPASYLDRLSPLALDAGSSCHVVPQFSV